MSFLIVLALLSNLFFSKYHLLFSCLISVCVSHYTSLGLLPRKQARGYLPAEFSNGCATEEWNSLCASNHCLAHSSLERSKASLTPPPPMMGWRWVQSYAGNHCCYEFRDTELNNNNSVRGNQNKMCIRGK